MKLVFEVEALIEMKRVEIEMMNVANMEPLFKIVNNYLVYI